MEETFAGRLLGYGTVEVRGIGVTRERLEGIRRPDELKHEVRSMRHGGFSVFNRSAQASLSAETITVAACRM